MIIFFPERAAKNILKSKITEFYSLLLISNFVMDSYGLAMGEWIAY
jgi:hypothetical protein